MSTGLKARELVEPPHDARAGRARIGVDASARPCVLLCGPPIRAIGGGPTHMRNLLASPLRERYRLVHFETGSRGRESPAKDEPWIAAWLRLLGSPFLLVAYLVRYRPAVMHVNSALVPKAFWRDLIYLYLGKAYGCKVVLQFHGGVLATIARDPFRRWLARRTFSTADALVALGQAARREIESLGARSRVIVIANGIDIAPYREPRTHEGGVRRLVYLGRLDLEKGLREAIEAVAHLRTRFPDIELFLAGSGDADAELKRCVKEKKLDGVVHFVGALHGRNKIELLRSADVFLFPSYQEGLPYAVLESLAAGTPVVATAVGDIPDVVEDGVHGYLIPARDTMAIVRAITRLRESPSTVVRMSHACHTDAPAQLSLERLARQFADLYDVLEGAPRRRAG